MKKTFCLILVICLCIVSTPFANASDYSETSISPRFAYITNSGVGLDIDTSLGIATCDADCYANGGYTVEVKCELQKYMGTYWVTLKSWTARATSMACVQGSWAVYSGYTYCSYATYKIYSTSGTLLETDTSYQSVFYPKQ